MNSLDLYLANRDQFKTGDMCAWRSDSLIGKAIRLKTVPDDVPEDSPYRVNHTSGIIRLSEFEGLERRVFITEALEHGAVLNLLSRRLEQFEGRVYWYPLKRDIWDGKRQSIGELALSFLGIPYDYESIVAQLFGNVPVDIKTLFCSEYYYRSLGFTDCTAPNPYEICKMEHFLEPVRIL